MEPFSSPRTSSRTSSRTPRSGPSWPSSGFGSTKYRSLSTTPVRSNPKTYSKTGPPQIAVTMDHLATRARGRRQMAAPSSVRYRAGFTNAPPRANPPGGSKPPASPHRLRAKHGGNTHVIVGNDNGTRHAYAAVVADIFDSYRLAQAWDEMFEQPGEPRAPYAALLAALAPLDPSELRFRSDQLTRVFTDRGVTFDFAGEERPFPLDLIPRVIDAVEWDLVSRGVRQRVRALEAFLADVYGPGHVFEDGVMPWRLIYTSPRFRREVADFSPPNGVRVHVAGIDLIRDEQGRFRVLEDNVRVPSGVSYVIENRLAMTRTFPALFAEQSVHRVDDYPARLLAALRAAAPP